MYSPLMVRPMREELTSIGVRELRDAAEVDSFLAEKSGLSLLIVNSVCGCAAGGARPAVRVALESTHRPDRVATVFAGVDTEATARARSHMADIPPSSPSMAVFKDGELVYFLPRHRIEGRSPQQIAGDLVAVFEEHTAAVSGSAAS